MMRWLIGSSLKQRLSVLVIAAAAMFVVFSFTHLHPTMVQARVSVSNSPESSESYMQSQAQTLGLFTQKVQALTTTSVEASFIEDESGNKREFRECMRSKVPVRDSLGLCSMRAELLIVVQSFGCRNAVLLI
jgi:hypothetical protein